jgi:hypothetical protein
MLKFSDILLYPRGFYGKLTNKKLTLCLGILFVGFVDLFMPLFVETFKVMFFGKTSNTLLINILVATGLVLLLGVLDVVVFALPMFDLFKYFKKKLGEAHTASAVKVMKAYISSYFILLPLQILLHYTLFKGFNENSSQMLQNLYALYFFVITIWSTAIITRGINTLFNMKGPLNRLTFFIVFLWNMVITVVFVGQLFPLVNKLLLLAGITLPV